MLIPYGLGQAYFWAILFGMSQFIKEGHENRQYFAFIFAYSMCIFHMYFLYLKTIIQRKINIDFSQF